MAIRFNKHIVALKFTLGLGMKATFGVAFVRMPKDQIRSNKIIMAIRFDDNFTPDLG
jgi:hypothetical protein